MKSPHLFEFFTISKLFNFFTTAYPWLASNLVVAGTKEGGGQNLEIAFKFRGLALGSPI